ncbi:MAG: NUDIX domain-containing protein [Parcubacteria group bacterium]|jgi:ADP-ribose pyrophosphatase YjhB (NUDIX family)/NTP pyrophosphatase (non-canonical NTP hydrolase)
MKKCSCKKAVDYIGVGGGVLILNEKGEALLMRRGKDVRNESGWWSKPGGGVKHGENAIDAITREIKEELNIEIDVWGYLPHTDHIIHKEKQHWVAFNYIACIISGVPKNMEPDKCDKIKWFALDALPKKITQTTREPIEDYRSGRYIDLRQKNACGMHMYYDAIQKFHDKFAMKGTNNEDMMFRLNLMIEELGELAQAITKGKSREEVIEENIDLLNLVMGNFISLGVCAEEVDKAFWAKHRTIMDRKKKMLDNGIYRVTGK